jgi:hypothetical protein
VYSRCLICLFHAFFIVPRPRTPRPPPSLYSKSSSTKDERQQVHMRPHGSTMPRAFCTLKLKKHHQNCHRFPIFDPKVWQTKTSPWHQQTSPPDPGHQHRRCRCWEQLQGTCPARFGTAVAVKKHRYFKFMLYFRCHNNATKQRKRWKRKSWRMHASIPFSRPKS